MVGMRKLLLYLCGVVLAWCACTALAAPANRRPPPVTAVVTNFYYEDLPAAKKWYVDELGFPVVYDEGGVVIVEAGPGMQIALVDAATGALKAVKDKGAMLAIETSDLEAWYEYVRTIPGIEWYPYNGEDPKHFQHGIRQHDGYAEFRVLDPGGYIVEFYRWTPAGP